MHSHLNRSGISQTVERAILAGCDIRIGTLDIAAAAGAGDGTENALRRRPVCDRRIIRVSVAFRDGRDRRSLQCNDAGRGRAESRVLEIKLDEERRAIFDP